MVVTAGIDVGTVRLSLGLEDAEDLVADLGDLDDNAMEIALEVWARDVVHVYEPERAFVAEGTFHYVAVDTNGRPRPVRLPSSESASAKPMLMPAPIEAASPTRKVCQF